MNEQALRASGHHQKLQFQQEQANQRRRTRKHNFTWFNPHYNDLISTNVGKRFFYLLEKNFPPWHRLHKIFNRNSIKLSCSHTTNMAGILSSHNKKILSEKRDNPDPPSCNCRKTPCPMSKWCREKSIVYKATVNCNNKAKNHFGFGETEFKARYYNHVQSFRHHQKSNTSELSKYVWSCRDAGYEPTIAWSIVCHAKPYQLGDT